jgi:hypothetical protein
MRRSHLAWMAAVGLTGSAAAAAAAGLDGGAPITCETSVTFDCAPDGDCIKDSPEAIDLPRLIRLDFAAKKAFTKSASGDERTADIASQQVDQDRLILQGVQSGAAWSLAVSQKTGVMSLSISGDEAAIVAFGTCEAF